ncbi:hypothetical protein [Candidatus Nucleicultrix amoebiphila]|jgi:hypothetical protein|uniref:hypothetical protein n=1 Tax=Candidatus Nucleicultrix amoebiphila TaxID=1509244 RepID=UPI000A26E172|nr:hypothetical protein [Candidatus Nucleicultrix amoebiphila]
MKIYLNEEEMQLLKIAASKGKMEDRVRLTPASPNKFLLSGAEDDFVDLRECCSDYLMIVGFDENYHLTKEGNILEKLIDKLYID